MKKPILKHFPGGRRPPSFTSNDDGFSARPPLAPGNNRPGLGLSPTPLAPVDNEIPDSANVQSSRGGLQADQGADVPNSRSTKANGEEDVRQAQLNLGRNFY